MGISAKMLKILLKESKRQPFMGELLTLGKQHTFVTEKDLSDQLLEEGLPIANHIPKKLQNNTTYPELAEKGYLDDISVFRSIGFDACTSVDYSDYEGADYIFDLNKTDIPEGLVNRFDVIIDGGTTEHIFHIPNVLLNIFKMLRVGGRIIHLAPSSNHIDHGFYMFSPTLFSDFYQVNQFDLNYIDLFRYTPNHTVDPWEISSYSPGCLERVSFGGLDDAMYGIVSVATKTSRSTGHIVPLQGEYERTWGRFEKRNQPNPDLAQSKLGNSNVGVDNLSTVVHDANRPATSTDGVCMDEWAQRQGIFFGRSKECLKKVPWIYDAIRFGYRSAMWAPRFVKKNLTRKKAAPLTGEKKGLGLPVVNRI